jgi:hypothetical protein
MKIWENIENPETGEQSLTENIQPKVLNKSCGDHYFKEEGATRFVKCIKCGFGTNYVLGKYKLEDGKLVKVSK